MIHTRLTCVLTKLIKFDLKVSASLAAAQEERKEKVYRILAENDEVSKQETAEAERKSTSKDVSKQKESQK